MDNKKKAVLKSEKSDKSKKTVSKDQKVKQKNNKKRRKGFTLAEILGVIVILGFLLMLLAPNLLNRLKYNSGVSESAANKIIYEAGREYVRKHKDEYPSFHCYCIPLKNLIDSGELVSPIVDIKTGKDISNTHSLYVRVNPDGTFNTELYKNNKCNPDKCQLEDNQNQILNIVLDGSDEVWQKERNATIEVTEGAKDVKYKIDDGDWLSYNEGDKINFKKNGKISARASYGGVRIKNEKDVIKVDSIAPKTPEIVNPSNGNWTKNPFALALKSKDNKDGTEGSGMNYYQYKYANTDWITYDNSASESFSTTNFSVDRNELVYIRACDKVGNCSEVSNTMIKIDKAAPVNPSIYNPTNGNWTRNDFSLNLYSDDTPQQAATEASGISYYQYSYDNNGWNTYSNSASKSFTTTPFSEERNQLAYLRVCDKAGNCSGSSSTMIRIDKTGPKFNGEIVSSWNSTSLGYRNFFGRNVTDGGSGLSNGNTNLYYCYESLPSGCGRSCTGGGRSGDAWNEPGTGNWLDPAQFDRPNEGATNYNMYSGVDSDCARGRCIRSYYKACDRVGNCTNYGVQRNCY